MTGGGVPWAWQDRARLCPLFRVTSVGISLKAGLMLMDSRMSCLTEPAALVATQVNTPASPGCVKREQSELIPMAKTRQAWFVMQWRCWVVPQLSRWSALLTVGRWICLEGWGQWHHPSPMILWARVNPEQHRAEVLEILEWLTAPSVPEGSWAGLKFNNQ